LHELEGGCEDYGQAVIYNGDIPEEEKFFKLDTNHTFEKGRTTLVCQNTFYMLKNTRFAPYFTFIGNNSTHYGIFKCCNESTYN